MSRGARSRERVEDIHAHQGAVGRQHDHRARRGSRPPGAERIGEVDPDQDPVRIPRARSGRWYPDPGSRPAAPITGAVLPARMPVRAAGSRARLDAVGTRQHGARIRLSHLVRDDQGEGHLQAGQGRPRASSASTSIPGRWWPRSARPSAPAWPSPARCATIRNTRRACSCSTSRRRRCPVDEVDHLLDRVSAMAATGVGVLYVTHHLGEVFRVAHKVSVFRDGVVVGAGPVKDFDHAAIVQSARGRGTAGRGDRVAAGEGRPGRRRATTRSCSRSRSCARARWPACPSRVERGEIVGIAGLAGSGRDSVLGASFGALPRTAGEVTVAR